VRGRTPPPRGLNRDACDRCGARGSSILRDQTKSELFRDLLPLLNSSCHAMIAFKAKSLGLSVAPARLAGTPSRIPTAAAMTWQMPLPARRRSPNSADTTSACAGCRATRAAHPSSSLHQQRGAHPTMTEFCLTLRAPGILRRLQFLGRPAPIRRQSNRSDITTCCGHNGRGSCSSTSVTPPRIRPPLLNHR
jgi:hypothetical protein